MYSDKNRNRETLRELLPCSRQKLMLVCIHVAAEKKNGAKQIELKYFGVHRTGITKGLDGGGRKYEKREELGLVYFCVPSP